MKREGLEFKTKSFQIRRGVETVLDVTYTEDDRSGNWPPKPPDRRPAETNAVKCHTVQVRIHAEAPKTAAAAPPRVRAIHPRRPTPNRSRPGSGRSSSSGFRPATFLMGSPEDERMPKTTKSPSTECGSHGRSTWASTKSPRPSTRR